MAVRRDLWSVAQAVVLSSAKGASANMSKWKQVIQTAKGGGLQAIHKLEHNHSHFVLVDDARQKLGRGSSSADLAW